MIGIYAAADAAHSAEAFAAPVRASWPQLETLTSNGALLPDLPLIGAGERPAWDDLLIVVFGADGLPAALHAPIQREIDSARAQRRASRVLPVATLPDHRCPPAPLQDVKAIHCRVGALLSLWLRGDERRVFVPHRQADGQPLAAQVAAYLGEQGYNAWRDEERFDGGDTRRAGARPRPRDFHLSPGRSRRHGGGSGLCSTA